MSTIRIATNFNIDLEFTAAPFHKRLFAWALDVIVLVFYLIIASQFLYWLMPHMGSSRDAAYNIWGIVMMLMLPFLLYHVVCEITMNGQSIGKKIMKIKVVNENGGRPSISQLIIRWLIRTSDYMILIILIAGASSSSQDGNFLKAVGFSAALLFTDVILVNTTQKSQRLGDLLAHTLVISTKQKADIEDTVFLYVDEKYVPQFPQVMQLSDRDINAIKGILDAAKKRHDYELAERASEKIKTHLNIQTSLSPYDFLEILLKDYNYLVSK